jgi:hypothetical protein
VAQLDHRLTRLDRHVLEEGEMQKPLLDPPVADTAPDATVLTGYDEEHLVTYLRLLDADSEGADWQDVARLVLHIDPVSEQERARRAWQSHLTRARWLTTHGIYATRPRRRTALKSRTDAARKNYALFRQCFSDGVW